MALVKTPFILVLLGTSLTTGRLSADWVPRLNQAIRDYPEAKGPVELYNMGKGSQNSAWGVTQTPMISALRPTNVLMEGFAINDCVDFGAGPAISRAQHIINIQQMVADLRSGNPSVDITIQTMNAVSAAGAAIRPQLADYYADEIATATTLGCGVLDNYSGWPHPLPDMASNGATIGYTALGGTWNPADKGTITLSGGNLTATGAGGGADLARGTVSALAGKKYFDTTVGNVSGLRVGFATAAAVLNNALGATAGGFGLDASGNLYSGSGVSLGKISDVIVPGDIMGAFIDFTLLRMWWSRNYVPLNGDPILGTGGLPFTAGTYYPAMSAANTGALTANFAAVYPGDGLHPLWTGSVDTYLYPNVLAFARAKMAALWP